MKNFEYHEPATVAEACRLLRDYGGEARVYAGGTHMTILMKQGLLRPKALVNIKRIQELRGIDQQPGGELAIGALVTHREIETSPLMQECWPIVCRVERDVANIRVRNMATLGGNLASGEPLTDLPCVFLSLDARLEVFGPTGKRSVALGDFFVDYYETVLAQDEVLSRIVLPPIAPHTGVDYIRFTSGSVVDKPCVGVSARISVEPNRPECREVRIALGCVAPTPMRAREAERILEGRAFNRATIEKAAASAASECSPLDDLRGSESYKREMVRVLVRKAVTRAHDRALNGSRMK